jgi:c-di-GMP-binding flagellar brake protein YcgR
VRKHRRIKVNIEVKYAIIGAPNWSTADMLDISLGGCRVVMKSKVSMIKGMKALLAFSLPSEDDINDLRVEVVRTMQLPDGETTEVGFIFIGPQSELAKVGSFCDFCLFFDVD